MFTHGTVWEKGKHRSDVPPYSTRCIGLSTSVKGNVQGQQAAGARSRWTHARADACSGSAAWPCPLLGASSAVKQSALKRPTNIQSSLERAVGVLDRKRAMGGKWPQCCAQPLLLPPSCQSRHELASHSAPQRPLSVLHSTAGPSSCYSGHFVVAGFAAPCDPDAPPPGTAPGGPWAEPLRCARPSAARL